MENNQRDFKWIWIPKEIWLNEDLSIMEKVLLVEITSLDWENGCFASNAYFAKFFGIIERNIRKHISQLKEKNLLVQESFDGRQRILRSNINSARSKSTGLLGRKDPVWTVEIDLHNNTYNNTTTSYVSKDTTEVVVTTKSSRVKRKKEFIKTLLPTSDEVFSLLGETKGTRKFYELISSVNLQQNITSQDIKSIYEWMIEFFKDKYSGRFYKDANGTYVWAEIVMDEIDKFTWYYMDHPEIEIKSIKWRLATWITRSSKYVSNNK